MTKIRIVASVPIDGQDGLDQYIGKEFETVELKTIYDRDVVKEMNELKEVAIYLEPTDKHVSVINASEYEIIQ